MTAGGPRPHKVLLVDDQPIIGESVRRMLDPEPDIAFHFERDPHQALARAIEIGPTVILQDLVMPDLDGLELVRRYREHDGLRHVPLVVLSLREEPEVKAEAFRLGANDYLVKLPSPLELVARVRYHSTAYLNACQSRLAYEALRESRELLQQRSDEIRRQRDALARQAQELELRNRFIRRTFGRYLSDEVVKSLLESPEGFRLGGEKKVVTILMSDLRGFTVAAEKLPPEQLLRLLNNYLGTMAEVIAAHRGTIDEFIGDAVLAIFGAPFTAPDDALRAVACAIAMQRSMERVNAWNAGEGLPRVEMGIALHTGEVVVGNIGSETRAKYGVVGSHVNITARIESCSVGGQVLLSEATRAAAGGDVTVGGSVEVSAKGFARPIAAHVLRGIGSDRATWLVAEDDLWRALVPPVEVLYDVLREKQMGGPPGRGRLARISKRRGELAAAEALPVLTDLRLRVLRDDGTDLPEDVYAKVVEDCGDGVVVVHFTSQAPGTLRYLETRAE